MEGKRNNPLIERIKEKRKKKKKKKKEKENLFICQFFHRRMLSLYITSLELRKVKAFFLFLLMP
jgi:hypothetical protein